MSWNHNDITNWVLQEGPKEAQLEVLTDRLAEKLVAVGVPLCRLRLAMRTVHPLATAVGTIWDRETGPQGPLFSSHGLEQRSAFKGSPMSIITETRTSLRRDLTRLDTDDHVALRELRERGATDYLGVPLLFGERMSGILITVTDRPGGFDSGDIEGIKAVAMALAPVVEVRKLEILSKAVAEAYLGPRTGQRVLGGEITRGHVDQIDAAILISDLRGWTRLNTELPVNEAVATANRYFEIMDQAVTEKGGEILKFMGDGVLAVFQATEDRAKAVQNAFAAAQNARAIADGAVEFGIGLHIGRVLYGNVGSETRLDFTVLGDAVNMAARIEALCGETGRPILASQAFAALLDRQINQIGRFALKGLPDPVPVFAPLAT